MYNIIIIPFYTQLLRGSLIAEGYAITQPCMAMELASNPGLIRVLFWYACNIPLLSLIYAMNNRC